MSINSFIQPLESRTFLSATPTPVLFSSAITIDRLHVRIDQLRFQVAVLTFDAKLEHYHHVINKDTPMGDTSLVGPFATLESQEAMDTAMLKAATAGDNTAEAAQEAVIKADIALIKKDKGNSTEESADHTKLMMDRATLEGLFVTDYTQRLNQRYMFESLITADAEGIVTANQKDPDTTPALTAAVTKFSDVRIAEVNTLTADLNKLSADTTTLENALAAAENS